MNCTSELALSAMVYCRQLLHQLTLSVFSLHRISLEKISKVHNLEKELYLSPSGACALSTLWSRPALSGYSENDALVLVPPRADHLRFTPGLDHTGCLVLLPFAVSLPCWMTSNGLATVSFQSFQILIPQGQAHCRHLAEV